MPFPLLSQYITHDVVLTKLIALRCTCAETYQKKFSVKYLVGKQNEIARYDCDVIYKIFPPRKRWVHISAKRRQYVKSQHEKNVQNLQLTIAREDKETIHADWYNRLEEYIDKIIALAKDENFSFATPETFAIEKKRKQKDRVVEARPICQFKTLEERIIVSLYNHILTKLFDPYFYQRSYAFRDASKRKGLPMQHLQAIEDISAFRTTYTTPLWVAECDMKKFYDTIDHAVIKRYFIELLDRSRIDYNLSNEDYDQLKRVMFSYVDCFSFYQNVYIYNSKLRNPFWSRIRARGYTKKIVWVEDDIKKACATSRPYPTDDYYRHFLGVPQGGALSGLIANIVMHFVDIKLKDFYDRPDFLYIRFCDDMIMMCPDKACLSNAFEIYKSSVKNMHLYIHDDTPMTFTHMRDFWKGKTRAPYAWGTPGYPDVMPWITFVGFDINWQGETRIRRSTYKKEIKKQYEKYLEIVKLFSETKESPLRTCEFIMESVRRRLVGMSVGRVTLWNYNHFENEMSWAKAFKTISDNSWTRHQLRNLDRHRNMLLNRLKRFLRRLNYDHAKSETLSKDHPSPPIYYGKPFSYFGQVLKK